MEISVLQRKPPKTVDNIHLSIEGARVNRPHLIKPPQSKLEWQEVLPGKRQSNKMNGNYISQLP
jgi:hypothetical protein